MRRDMELVRVILLEIEKASERNIVRRQKSVEIPGISEPVILDHIALLQNAGLLTNFLNQFGGEQKDTLSISWAGYEFLDSVRDEEVWRRTKAASLSVGGFAVSTLVEVAKAIVKDRISKLANLEIAS